MSFSDYRLIRDSQTLYLHNHTGAPVVGGSMLTPQTTPLLIVQDDWRPGPPEAQLVAGGDDQELIGLSYDPVTETIPLLCRARNTDDLAQILEQLNTHATLTTAPAVLWCRPRGATNPILFAVTRVEARALPLANGADPGEGATDVAIALRVRRSPYGGASALTTLASGVSVGNTGTGSPNNLVSLGTLRGDLRQEGQPLNIRLDKPTGQSPISVFLASAHSRAYASIASAKTTNTSATFTASGSIDVSALRTRAGLHLHVVGRLTTLTAPSNAQVRVTVQTPAGATLWVGPWVPLGSNTVAQLVDLGGIGLDALRVPLTGTQNIVLVGEIRSTSGSVTATLAYLEAILAYDWCVVELPAALAASQRLHVLGAENLSGGPYLPLALPQAIVTDTSDSPVRPCRPPRGTAPRAIQGASLYVAWVDANGAHTASDTTTLTIQHAPLWRTTRGAS